MALRPAAHLTRSPSLLPSQSPSCFREGWSLLLFHPGVGVPGKEPRPHPQVEAQASTGAGGRAHYLCIFFLLSFSSVTSALPHRGETSKGKPTRTWMWLLEWGGGGWGVVVGGRCVTPCCQDPTSWPADPQGTARPSPSCPTHSFPGGPGSSPSLGSWSWRSTEP